MEWKGRVLALGNHLRSSTTFMIASVSGSQVRSFRIPKWFLYSIAAGITAGALCTGLYVFGAIRDSRELHSQILSREAQLREVMEENVRLREERAARDKTIRNLEEKTRQLEEQIGRLEGFAADIQGLLSGTPVSSQLPSRGGLTRGARDGAISSPVSDSPDSPGEQGRSARDGEDLNARLDGLLGRARELESRMASLTRATVAYRENLSRTPAGWPARGRVTSRFGYRRHPISKVDAHHDGIDIAMPEGTPVRATAKGIVEFAGWQSGYGYVVIISHGNGYQTVYGHNSRLVVKPGQHVSEGQVIAYSGSTGTSTGPHLHYEVRKDGRAIDPAPYLRRAGIR